MIQYYCIQHRRTGELIDEDNYYPSDEPDRALWAMREDVEPLVRENAELRAQVAELQARSAS